MEKLSRASKSEYKARALYAVAMAKTPTEARALYREFAGRMGFEIDEEIMNCVRLTESEDRVQILKAMLTGPYSKGGKTTMGKMTKEQLFAMRSKGGKIGKRGPAQSY